MKLVEFKNNKIHEHPNSFISFVIIWYMQNFSHIVNKTRQIIAEMKGI